ncbi:MAG: transporter substrate-binding domain-containing protein [Sedimentisphaerales bacterium]|nr:transporter substrate-binding domain-containing protein [Sedimentisphaerales bacterium]
MPILPALMVILFCLVTGVCIAGPAQSNVPILRVAVLEHRFPHFVVDDNGKSSGLAIDMVSEVASIAGFRCEYVIVDNWEEAVQKVDEGLVDLIPGANIVPELGSGYQFSRPTEMLDIVCYQRKGSYHKAQKLSEIKDSELKVGVLKYSPAYYHLLNELGRYNITRYTRLEMAIMSLLSDEIDVLFHARLVTDKFLDEFHIKDKFIVIDEPLLSVKKAFLLANEAVKYQDVINASLERMEREGELAAICSKWYAQTEHGVSKGYLVVFVGILVLGVFSVLWNYKVFHKKSQLMSENEKYLKSILDASDCIFLVMKTDYTVKYVNDFALLKFQYGRDEVIGQNGLLLFVPEFDTEGSHSRELVDTAIRDIYDKTGKTSVVNQNISKHGRRFWVAWTNCWIRDPKTGDTELYCFGIDITSQKDFEYELKKTKMELEVILDNIGAGVLFLGPDLEVLSVNKEMETIVGSSRELLLGKKCNDVVCLRGQVSPDCPAAMATRTAQRVCKEAYLTLNGQIYDVISSPLVNALGRVLGTISIFNDVTERNMLLENLKKAHDSLEYYTRMLEDKVKVGEIKLEEQQENLRNAQNQLIQAEKMASLGNLIAGIGHEINSPLGAIKSSGEIIQHSLAEFKELSGVLVSWLTSEQAGSFFEMLEIADSYNNMELTTKEIRKKRAEIVEKLESAGISASEIMAQRLLDIGLYDYVDNYLELLKQPEAVGMVRLIQSLSQVHHGTELISCAVDRAHNVVFALKNFIHTSTTRQMLQTNIKENINMVLIIYCHQIKHGIEVEQDLENLPDIMCYPDELNQVWSNLINNAIQAMDGHGKLKIAGVVYDDKIRISFTDTGCGIPEDIREVIFQPLFTTKPAGQGSGMGLDIVSKIVKKHKGSISVDSVLGSGSTFTVTLPIITEQPDQEVLS